MIYFYIFISILVILFVLHVQFIKDFFQALLDRFSAWHLNHLVKNQYLITEISIKSKELFSSMEEIINTVDGPTLEMGCGNGRNLPFYPKNTRLITCDLNDFFKPYLLKNLDKHGIKLEKYLIGNCEDMRELIPDNSCSCVVSSLLLCCVDQEKVLQEVMRILKPGGRFYFIEHFIEPPGSLTRWIQIMMTPFWAPLRFNCHLDRETDVMLTNFGFDNFKGEVWYRPLPIHYFFARNTFVGYGDKPK